MCTILDNAINKGIEQGIEQGIERGITQGENLKLIMPVSYTHLTLPTNSRV